MRESLKKYYGCDVIVEGQYVGAPIGHTRPVKVNELTGLGKNEKSKLLIKVGEAQPPFLIPLYNVTQASCIKNVQGINEFIDIKEDHVNIQINIADDEIKCGDRVRIWGYVTCYNNNNYTIQVRYYKKI